MEWNLLRIGSFIYERGKEKMPCIQAITDPADRSAIFDQVLRCLDREENLIHYRMSWCLQWTLAIFGLIVAVQIIKTDAYLLYATDVFSGGSAAVISVVSFIGIRAAHDQIKYLINELEDRLGIRHHNWDTTEFIRPYGNPYSAHPAARVVSAFIPLALLLAAVVVFVYGVSGIEGLVASHNATKTDAQAASSSLSISGGTSGPSLTSSSQRDASLSPPPPRETHRRRKS